MPASSLRNALLLVAFGSGLVLLLPLLAMQFTREVQWSAIDFALAWLLLFAAGGGVVLAARGLRGAWRGWVIALLLLGFVLTWAQLAVGVFD